MPSSSESHTRLFLRFLRFGMLAWGGPVAQIGMLREELVDKEQWVTPEKFNRILAVYQALPGPEAHELCVYFGMTRKGRIGGLLAGLGFMLPGFFLIILMAAAYMALGADTLLPLFVGVAPAVAALILRALYRLGKHTLINGALWIAAFVSAALTALDVNFIMVFGVCALWQALWMKGWHGAAIIALALTTSASIGVSTLSFPVLWAAEPGSGNLLAEGLKAGLLSFGGAYTALPFLKEGLVGLYDTVTPQAFIDGLALSSVIPAPLVIFGTFLGYLAGGLVGALLITAGIFAPAFAFTLLGHDYLEKAVENKALHALLDGIAAAVIGILFLTAWDIVRETVEGPYALLIALGAFAAYSLLRTPWAVPATLFVAGAVGLLIL